MQLFNALHLRIVSRWIIPMIAFYFFITLAGVGLILSKYNRNPGSFIIYYFIVMGARFMISLLFLWLGLSFFNESRIIFVTNFLTLYLLFLGFEIYYLMVIFQSGIRK